MDSNYIKTHAVPSQLPAWINTQLFEELLKSEIPNAKRIKNFAIQPVLSRGGNYNSSVLKRIKIQVTIKGSKYKYISFILKLPLESYNMKSSPNRWNPLELETCMYQEIIPELEQLYLNIGLNIKFGPQKFQLKSPNSHLLLEDLEPLGFRNNIHTLCDIKHTQCVLKKLAQWHAASARHIEVKGVYTIDFQTGLKSNLSQQKLFLQCVKNYNNNEDYIANLERLIANNTAVNLKATQIIEHEFKVLNHGDCCTANIMFQYDAAENIKETYFLDHRIPKYCSPVLDLYNFLLTSTKLEIKLKNFEDFVRFYFEELIKHLKLLKYEKELPTLKDLHMALNNHGVWAYITATETMATALINFNDFECNGSSSNESIDFSQQLYSNPNYHRHIEAVLPWLLNRGALDF